MSVSICSIPESQVTQPNITVGQVVTKRNVYLMLSGQLDNGQCHVASQKNKLDISDKFVFIENPCKNKCRQ